MTFADLPPELAHRPLTDQRLIADVIDLLVSHRDRIDGCVLFVLCDPQARLVQPCLIHDVPSEATGTSLGSIADVFVGVLAATEPPGSLLVVFGRAAGLSPTKLDQEWATGIVRSCAERVTLLGVHIVTPEGSRPVPSSGAAA
jgi:hypothetical protein